MSIHLQDKAAVVRFVERVSADGVEASLPVEEVIGIKFECTDDLELIAYEVTSTTFGTAEVCQAQPTSALGKSARELTDDQYDGAVATLRSWVREAWLSCSRRRYKRGWFSVHDTIWMTDLDSGVEAQVDFDDII